MRGLRAIAELREASRTCAGRFGEACGDDAEPLQRSLQLLGLLAHRLLIRPYLP